MERAVYYISDGTGLSAEALGHSLITQFKKISFQSYTLPYIDSIEKAEQAVIKINNSNLDKVRPLVFSTIVQPEIRRIIAQSDAFVIDFFQAFITPLEQELQVSSLPAVGLSHGLKNFEHYQARMEAVNFALSCDDGMTLEDYKTADIILLGVSRSGKTPTCLYLALQFGIRAANFPLTPENFDHFQVKLPASLNPYRKKLFGLIIDPERLSEIRQKRHPKSDYASFSVCEQEVHWSEKLFLQENLPYLNSTHLSIEELSTQLITQAGLRRCVDS